MRQNQKVTRSNDRTLAVSNAFDTTHGPAQEAFRLDSMAAKAPREPSLRRPPPEPPPLRLGRWIRLPETRALALLSILLFSEYVRHENYVEQWSHTRQKEREERWRLREQTAAQRTTAADWYYGRHRLRLGAPAIPDVLPHGDYPWPLGAQLSLMTGSNNPPIVSPPARALAWGSRARSKAHGTASLWPAPLRPAQSLMTLLHTGAGEPLPWVSSVAQLHFWFLCWRQWSKR